ncbi:ecdysteroid-regulated 16 kDa protein [Anoplophora glabripennis]|uniref:ecdysteroid-regulated 16 kDa protein n=1 Tax=Anoplophora glabripennis TaxID=217634 RepID=UPI0008738694|nr:ecdysteroid-regulated 16 kDa protein [Anoplophora glabripennis]
MKVFLVLLGLAAYCSATQVKQCKGIGRSIEDLNERVKIGACNKPPCRLRKDSVVGITLKFKPDHDIKSLVNTVNANILGIPFPFAGVDGVDACKNIYNEDGTTKVGCNIKAGQEYLYKSEIEVLKIYPRVKTVVHWGLTEPDGQDVICFEVPARITN